MNFLALLFTGRKRQKPKPSQFRPSIEVLEDRWCPADYTWDPVQGQGFLWHNAQNWIDSVTGARGTVPGAGDSATFVNNGAEFNLCVVAGDRTIGQLNIAWPGEIRLGSNQNVRGRLTVEGWRVNGPSVWNGGHITAKTKDSYLWIRDEEFLWRAGQLNTKEATDPVGNLYLDDGADLYIENLVESIAFNIYAGSSPTGLVSATESIVELAPNLLANIEVDKSALIEITTEARLKFSTEVLLNDGANGGFRNVTGDSLIRVYGKVSRFAPGDQAVETQLPIHLVTNGRFSLGESSALKITGLYQGHSLRVFEGEVHLDNGSALEVAHGLSVELSELFINNYFGTDADVSILGDVTLVQSTVEYWNLHAGAFGSLLISGDVTVNTCGVYMHLNQQETNDCDRIFVNGQLTVYSSEISVTGTGGAIDAARTWDLVTASAITDLGTFGTLNLSHAAGCSSEMLFDDGPQVDKMFVRSSAPPEE